MQKYWYEQSFMFIYKFMHIHMGINKWHPWLRYINIFVIYILFKNKVNFSWLSTFAF